MASLAQLPNVVGFFSYSREDDEAFRGSLSHLCNAIERELGAGLGLSKRNFRLWQDQEAIAPRVRVAAARLSWISVIGRRDDTASTLCDRACPFDFRGNPK